ncbi:MAG: biotin--[acetyl-CoA-carboxylase] ligase [Myxococcaceae bacterium]
MSLQTAEQDNEGLVLSFLAEAGDDYTSGEALSDKLGLSRTAVWKHVESLRHKGYRIDAVPARGYRLVEIPDRLTELELMPLLSTSEIGQEIHYSDTLASTNEEAFRLANDEAPHGAVVICEEQTSGKGRRGRAWASPPCLNLYCSVILRPDLPPQRAPELTLVAAVALAQTLVDSGAKARIKWPNDVQVDDKKIAGILTELSADVERVHFAVVGLGVNLNSELEDFPPDVAELATSLVIARGERVPRALFTAALFARLEQWLEVHAEEGFGRIREAWKSMSSTLGHEVLVKTDKLELRGMAEDIDEAGALMVRAPDGTLHRILAGDVTQLRPKSRKGE